MNNQKRKVSVTREELVAITGDNIAAQILNQLIYWSSKGSGEWIIKEPRSLRTRSCLAPSIRFCGG